MLYIMARVPTVFRSFKCFLLGQLHKKKKHEGDKKETETARTETIYAFHVRSNTYATEFLFTPRFLVENPGEERVLPLTYL